jgi:hypothetical protein
VVIGSAADVGTAAAANRIAIGEGASCANDNQAVIGNSSCASIISNGGSGCALGTTLVPFGTANVTDLVVKDTTIASSNTTGAIQSAGGISSQANVWAGTNLVTNGTVRTVGTLTTQNSLINVQGPINGDTPLTSVSFTNSNLLGVWQELYYADLNSTANWTSDTTVQVGYQTATGTQQMNNASGAINGYLDLAATTACPLGAYMVEYVTQSGNNRGKWQISYKGNNLGYVNLRAVYDGYAVSETTHPMRDFFVISNPADPLNIRWTCASHNNSSAAYFVMLSGFVRITRIA